MSIGSFLSTNFLNGVISIALLLVAFKIFDWITPDKRFNDVFFSKGVSGGSIIVAAFLLGLSIVLAAAGF